MVELRKVLSVSVEKQEKRQDWHTALAGAKGKRKREKEKHLEIVYIFGIRVPLIASSASEPPQTPKDDKTNHIKDNLFNSKMHGKVQLTVARCNIPSEFFPQSNLTPILFWFLVYFCYHNVTNDYQAYHQQEFEWI